MKSYKKELYFNLPKRRGLVNITREVQQAIDESGVKEGLCLVNPMHITASVIINDDEPGLHRDYERLLERLAPEKPYDQYDRDYERLLERLAPEKPYDQYDHNGFEDNADAHLKRSLMGRESVVAITDGRLDFGPWEQIFYYEFDGMRNKRLLIKIIGE